MKYNLSNALSNLLAYVAYFPLTLKKLHVWGGSCLCWQRSMCICQSAVLHTEVPVWLSRPVILSTLWLALEINPITAITHQQTGESINPDQSDMNSTFYCMENPSSVFVSFCILSQHFEGDDAAQSADLTASVLWLFSDPAHVHT